MYRFQSPELNYMNLDEASFSVKFSPFTSTSERDRFDGRIGESGTPYHTERECQDGLF